MLICHSCGIPVEKKSRQCHQCHSPVSANIAIGLIESQITNPLKVQLELQPGILDRLIAHNLIKASNFSKSQLNASAIQPAFENNVHHGSELDKIDSVVGNHYKGPNGNGNGDMQTAYNDHDGAKTGATGKDSVQTAANDNGSVKTETGDNDDVRAITNLIAHTDDVSMLPSNQFVSRVQSQPTDFFANLPDVLQKTMTADNESRSGSTATDQDQFPANFQATDPTEKVDSGIADKNGNPENKNIQTQNPDTWFLPQTTGENNNKGSPAAASTTIPAAAPATAPAAELAAESTANNDLSKNDSVDKPDTVRRSFSGLDKTIAAEKKETADTKSAPSDNIQSILARLKTGLNIQSSWPKLLGITLVIVFLLFKGFEAFCLVGSSLFNNISHLSTATRQAVPFSGRWQFASRWNNGACQGQMIIHQHANQIFGEGVDNGIGQYKFQGTSNGDHLSLLKQYFIGNNFIGYQVELQGDLESGNKPLFMHGDFNIQYMQGGKWRGKPVVINGIWEAEMIQPLIEDDNNSVSTTVIRDQRPASVLNSFFNNLAKNGVWIIFGLAVLGWGAWHTMSSLIGPDGWIGIWDKQRYVPPQFAGEHKKEKRQLSKPLVPGSLPLGSRWEWHPWQKPFFWIPKDLALPPEIRANNPHVLILGGGEKGKSRLMANMIAHDIESADRAVVVVDSDGDLVDLLLRWISAHANGQELAKRTLVIDPTSNLPAPSFNPLQFPEDGDMQNATSAIVHGFKAIYHEAPGSQNQWSPQTAHILRNSAMLLMANGKTLVDLPTLLQDNEVRDILLEQIERRREERVEFATLLETWGQYKRLARTEQWINWYEPILNRVSPTLTNLRLRPILTQAKAEINLKQIITDKKILIVKIPKGQLHDDANLLGSLIVTGLKQAAISLCTEGKLTDRTVSMYLDEFDNFIEKETLDAITTETKKFQLSFIGSTKTLQHMPEDFRNQIVINIGTMCVFALSKKDGDMIGPQMFRVSGRKAKHRTLMNLVNKVNTSPQFELISDEEKYNIDRILGQSERHFYAYRVGTVAGTFHMKCHDFNDIPDNKVDAALLELMYKNR